MMAAQAATCVHPLFIHRHFLFHGQKFKNVRGGQQSAVRWARDVSAHHGKHLLDGHKLAARSTLRCASCNLRLHMMQKIHPSRYQVFRIYR